MGCPIWGRTSGVARALRAQAAVATATERATVSVGPPAANGTTIETGRVGYCCAEAVSA